MPNIDPTPSKGQARTQSCIQELNCQLQGTRKRIAQTEWQFDGLTQAGKEEAHKLLKELWATEAVLEVEIWEPLAAYTSPIVAVRKDQLTEEAEPPGSGVIPQLMGGPISTGGWRSAQKHWS